MKFLELHLCNIKKHNDLRINFNGSTTMILGQNGSGKSTIVESIYYALFRSLLVPSVEYMVSDTAKKIGDDGKVAYVSPSYIELLIEHKEKKYSIKSGLAKSKSSLKVFENNEWVEKSSQITDMYNYIKNNILDGMTPEYFINTIYTEQMGILKLVDKNEAPRQQEFDKLIGIDRFQRIHTGLSSSYTLLNKMKRNDITELAESKKKKEERLKELEDKKNEIDSDFEKLEFKKKMIKDSYSEKETKLKVLEEESKKLYNLYIEANDLASKIVEYKKLSENATKELKELEGSIKINDIKKEHDNLVGSIKINYDLICEKVAELFNYIDGEKEKLNTKIDSYNEDIKVHEYINFHNKMINETYDKLKTYEKSISEKSEEANELKKDVSKLKADVENLQEIIDRYNKEILNNELTQQSILKNYQNENYNFQSIKDFFESNDEEYDGFEKEDCYCNYCGSHVTKDKMLERLSSDKKIYHSTQLLIERLHSECLQKEESYSLIKDTYISSESKLSSLENDLKYTLKIKEDYLKKINTSKQEVSNLELKIKNKDVSYQDMLLELNDAKTKLSNMVSTNLLKPMYAYKDVSTTNTSKNHDVTELVKEIASYQEDHKKEQLLSNRIKDFESKHKAIAESIIKYKSFLTDFYPLMQEKIQESDSVDLNSMYEKVKQSQELVNEKKIDLGNIISTISNIDDLIKSNKSFKNSIDIDINNLKQDITSIDDAIKNDALIDKKLNMVNVAKTYFKQDGLAKHIRKYYIDKINENMTNYVHLFSFDFTPKIDETAGIEDYHKYSGGQKIAIAILMKMILNFILKNPINVMILDEPTPYMDTERIEAIKEMVNCIKDKLQVLVITHDTEFMTIECNKIILGGEEANV